MSVRWGRAAVLSLVLVFLCSKTGRCSHSPIIESMGDKSWCKKYSSEIQWISEKTSALISGRTVDSIRKCQLIFGLATTKENARLRLNFEFIYIHDCGVRLQINESFTSDFPESKTNREMFYSRCNTVNPGPLYAQPKNFVLISLQKESKEAQAYNFRLNISMAEQLPTTGPKLHVVIIVGFVLVVVVGMSAVLLFKYVARISTSWHERQVAAAMTRAINIYNSQEGSLEEPDLVYISPGGQGSQPTIANDRNHPRNNPCGAEIAFVHADGRVERFRPHNATANQRNKPRPKTRTENRRHSSGPHRGQAYVTSDGRLAQCTSGSLDSTLARVGAPVNDQAETASLGGCDLPPSYEEALEMPTPGGGKSSVQELEGTAVDEEETMAIGGRLEVDYMNVRMGNDGGNVSEGDRDGESEEACGSDQALLSSTKRDSHS